MVRHASVLPGLAGLAPAQGACGYKDRLDAVALEVLGNAFAAMGMPAWPRDVRRVAGRAVGTRWSRFDRPRPAPPFHRRGRDQLPEVRSDDRAGARSDR